MTELLDLTTVVKRDTIRLRSKKHPAGKQYALINPEELGAFEHAQLTNGLETMQRLGSITGRKLSAKETRELNKALGDMLKMLVIDLEPATLTETEDVQRARIISAWSQKAAGAAVGEAPPAARARRSTTARSSRGSKPSTAAARKTGSTSRRTR